MQFHLEVDEKLGTEWKSVPAYEHAADLALGPGGLDRVMTDFRTHAEEMQDHARMLISGWLDLVEQRRDAQQADADLASYQ